ncbi:FACT complex subunit [Komagataella phaffii CBS 7435]|nr:GQ67_02574T0 [Komagataella phaffii]AOA65832.1 GQ68_02674T0 [Komagataella phaffii GS115]CAH2446030.1 FACT complex subunit [Komagataella phaffii CBS 7435]CCA36471.1 FACT complex subunit [Komagataella phaffii CBS 7435]
MRYNTRIEIIATLNHRHSSIDIASQLESIPFMSTVDFDTIFLNQSKAPGRFRITSSGLGWKPSSQVPTKGKTDPFLLPSGDILSVSWSRGYRGWELRVYTRNDKVIMLDGFEQQDFQQLKNEIQRTFNVNLEHKEHSLRGWNWGKTQLTRAELVFNVNNRPAWEIPYSEISNSNLTGRHEISMELNPKTVDENHYETLGDELVEVRLYVPGQIDKDEDSTEGQDTTEEAKSKSQLFYEQLKDKADFDTTSEAIVSFEDILFLTPRGRFEISMYANNLRLRGQSYDYKIQNKNVLRIFSLPRLDDRHHLVILQVDPPLRQGQTRYPFLVMQFDRNEELEVELNLSDEEYKSKYEGKLNRSYGTDSTYKILSHCLRGLTERRVITPGSFQSQHMQPGVNCSLKASEGQIYLLDKCLFFATKPCVYLPYSGIISVVTSRGTGQSTSRTFDIEVQFSGGSHTFANINKDEQKPIEDFLKGQGVRVKNEKPAEFLGNALVDDDDDSDDGDIAMGSAGEDDESVDEDFNAGSDSDVAEEYDSNAGSEDEDSDASSGEPEKKKPKH